MDPVQKTALPLWIKGTLSGAILFLLVGGVWFFKVQQGQQKKEVETRLRAIAELKAGQIAKWRAERLADAAVFAERRSLIASVKRFFSAPTQADADEILRLFRPIRERYHFVDILLADPEKRVRLSLSGKTDFHKGFAETLDMAIAARKPVWTPIHRDPEYPHPHLAAIVPLFEDPDATLPLGAVILMNDAAQFLYPLIQSWPTPSKTAETLLVRRDGDHILFLNELRHQKDTALKLRIPVSRSDLPAAMAVSGKKGIVEGKDYRGVKVLAAVLPVPDSPWFMISKMDFAEAFSDWHFRSALIVVLMLGAMGLVLVAGLVAWQRNLKGHYRALYQSEAAVRAAVEKQAVTLKAIGDAVIATDASGRVELLNPMAESLTGWNEDTARGKPLGEVFKIINEETRNPVEDPVARVLKEGVVVGLANHTLLIRKDGNEIPIADSGAPIRDDHGGIIGVVLVFRDQSGERLSQKLTDVRLSLIEYASGNSLDDLMTRALDEVGAVVESPIGFYHFVEADEKTLSLQAWSTRTRKEFCKAEGKGMHYAVDQAGVWVDCVHQRRPVIHNAYASLPHKKGLPEGHAPIMRELVVPVIREGKIVAILGVGNKSANYTEKDAEVVSYLADVTWEIVRYKRADEALRASEDKFKYVFEHSPIGKSTTLPSGEIQANRAFYRMLGYSEAESPHIRWQEVTHPEDMEASQRVVDSLLSGEKDEAQFVKRYIHKDGSVVWAEVSVSLRRDAQGHPQYFMSTINDITQRRQAEEALEQERDWSKAIIEAAPNLVVGLGEGSRIMVFNRFAEHLTGYSAQEVLGKAWIDLFIPEGLRKEIRGVWDEIVARCLIEHRYENPIVTQTGEERMIRWNNTVLTENGKFKMVLSIGEDITDQKKAEFERERLQEQLMQAQKMESVGRLAGGVAHDFNNMLGVILGRTEMLLMGMDSGDPRYHELEEIEKAARRSADLTRQLLAFARKQTIAPKVLDLNETVEGMLKMLRRLIGEDMDLMWKPDADLWPVKMDPAQIDQMLANLAVNARDAISGTGKITIETENVLLDESYCRDHVGFLPGRLCDAGGERRRMRDGQRDPIPAVRAVFHHQGSGEGDGAGVGHRVRHREAESRVHQRLQRTRAGNDV